MKHTTLEPNQKALFRCWKGLCEIQEMDWKPKARQVVKAFFLTDNHGIVHDEYEPYKFSHEEESAIEIWENVLNMEPMVKIVQTSSGRFKQTKLLTPHMVNKDGIKEWIALREQVLWRGFSEALEQNGTPMTPESAPCLHLLCYMLSLTAVVTSTTAPTRDLQLELAIFIWNDLLQKTGTSLNPKEIMFMPTHGCFQPLMQKIGGLIPIRMIVDWVYRKATGVIQVQTPSS